MRPQCVPKLQLFPYRGAYGNVCWKWNSNGRETLTWSAPLFRCAPLCMQAIVRPWRLGKLTSVLSAAGIRGMTVSEVLGAGIQGGIRERFKGTEYGNDVNFLVEKCRVDIVVTASQVDTVVRMICTACYTGEVGDGKIFVHPVADVVRVRTGETGETGEKMIGGMSDLQSSSS